MSNAYVIQSMTYTPAANNPNPWVTVVGTVNGTQVTISILFSRVTAAASVIAFENLIRPLMLAAYERIVPPSSVSINPVSGSFTA